MAALNLQAGRRAKAASAYASAYAYLAAGMALFEAPDWDGQYKLLFDLWLEGAECAFLSGEFDLAARHIGTLLQRAASNIDLTFVYNVKIQLEVAQSKYAQAVESGLTCLRRFGIDFPAHPNWEQVQAEYEAIWEQLGERPIESLIDLPRMTDPEIQAAMRVLSILFDAAYFTDPSSFVYCSAVS